MAPEFNTNTSEIVEGLNKCVELVISKIKRPKGELLAVIAGGKWNTARDNNSLISMDLMNTLAKYFDEREIPLSIIFGKKVSENSDNAFVQEYILTLWNKLYNTLKLDSDSTKDEISKQLENIYEVVEIAPEHNLRFDKTF